MNYSFPGRIKILSVLILIFSLVLIGKLFLVQVVHSSAYGDRADRQYATPASDIFERGTIYFSRKGGELASAAIQTTGYKIAIDTGKLGSAEEVYKKLYAITTIDHEQFLNKAKKKNDPYEEIANKLTKEKADKISALSLAGVSIFKEKWRFYPAENLAAQSIGFVGYKGNELAGRYGLERQYEKVLTRGKDNPYVNFFAEVFSNIKDGLFSDDGEEAADIVTTIEPTVEEFLNKKLGEVRERYSADGIGGIIMNPKDGSIYALGVRPDFDLNNFSKVKTSTFSNPLVENVYEFGSVVKPLVMAAALDAKVVNAATAYDDSGRVVVDGKKEIFNFDKEGRGPGTSMQEVLSQSLNTGMVYVFHKLGKTRMHDYLLSFGIKDKTGIDLPNEAAGLASGLTSNLKNSREIEYANASFGQGIALSPIEMTRALASLGNGGKLVVPHLVKEVKYELGKDKKMTYPETDTKISPETAKEITRMMVSVMDSYGEGKVKLENYSIAAKTGTAQVANNQAGGYYEDRHTHSFVGYFPAYDPEFIIFLYAVNPKGVRYSSETWTTPFLDITKFLINYYEVPPDR